MHAHRSTGRSICDGIASAASLPRGLHFALQIPSEFWSPLVAGLNASSPNRQRSEMPWFHSGRSSWRNVVCQRLTERMTGIHSSTECWRAAQGTGHLPCSSQRWIGLGVCQRQNYLFDVLCWSCLWSSSRPLTAERNFVALVCFNVEQLSYSFCSIFFVICSR